MEEIKIFKSFEGKTILITGATGFLAKIFVEKILRVQPNIKKLFLLIRETNKTSIEQRLQQEVVGTELFRVLREWWGEDFNSVISSKVIPISGDVTCMNLGIVGLEMREEMCREIDIIVNSAGTTNFNERYDVALGINALGAMHVQDFARKCSKLKMLLHVSTVSVHGKTAGLIPERKFHMGETLPGSKITYLDIEEEKKIIEEKLRGLEAEKATEKEITRAMKDLGTERAKLHGWPNTYVFTKAIGEMILEDFKENANVVIIRPSIITSTYKEPFPGWIEGVRTLDSIFVAYGKGNLKFFLGDPESTVDTIPGDMVVNCMLAAIASHSNDEHDLFVYHVGSSRRNPVKYEEIKRLMHRYLIQNPMHDSRGKPIKVGQVTILNTMTSFNNYVATHYLPFLKNWHFVFNGGATLCLGGATLGLKFFLILKIMNVMCCNHFESMYSDASRRINYVMRLAEFYKPYLFFQGVYDDINTDNLRSLVKSGSNVNIDVLNFDPLCIEWDDYFVGTHFPGIAKYALNESRS